MRSPIVIPPPFAYAPPFAACRARYVLLALGCFWFAPLGSTIVRGQESVGPEAGYEEIAERLTQVITWELGNKPIPAISVALVDGTRIVWARGFGQADAAARRAAGASTIYRAGSISKLLTDVAIMQLVEQGRLDLDAPLDTYVDDVRPRNPYEQPITLRHLMSHRAGLVREPPVGNYFDDSQPSLRDTVRSLNTTSLVYPPGQRTKYSNAGIAVVGYVLECITEQPFEEYMRQKVLEPLGMSSAAYKPIERFRDRMARGVMWAYDGRSFTAPEFLLGTSAAGNLYASVLDLAEFQKRLFACDEESGSLPLRRSTLQQMFEPQFAEDASTPGFGLGFYVSSLDGHRRISHGGAVYGHATHFSALPDDRLGVVVMANLDVANGVVDRLGNYAMRLLLHRASQDDWPEYVYTTPLTESQIASVIGRYRDGDDTLEISSLGPRAWLRFADRQLELRAAGNYLLPDDVLGRGPQITLLDKDGIQFGERRYERLPDEKPPPAPERWRGLIGEYGWDHNTLFILEDHGRLVALIEWCFFYPLTEIDESTFAFPEAEGLYHGERLVFQRDAQGRATSVVAAEVRFPRRDLDADSQTFRIQPVESVDTLRTRALAAHPPNEEGEFLPSDLRELIAVDDSIRLDIRYAGTNNFLGTPVYSQARAFLQAPAAEALARVHRRLAEHGLGVLVFDGYRPWYVTKIFYDATPESMKIFVADPSRGSRHNRGCAVDLSLFDRRTGQAVEMVSGYDEFSPRAFPRYPGGTSLARWHRDLLRRTMESEGFQVYEFEWWHFDFHTWRRYAIQNIPFEKL